MLSHRSRRAGPGRACARRTGANTRVPVAACRAAAARDTPENGGGVTTDGQDSELLFIARQQERSALFEIESTPDNFWVVRFDGSEGLSALYEFEVEVLARHVDIAALIGRNATLKIVEEAEPRLVHGIVLRVEYVDEVRPRAQYRFTIVPWIHRLLMRTDCRIFNKLRVDEIVTRVLREAGLPSTWARFKLSKTYPLRETCVQYRESDLNFIHRLLEEEGIYYYFEHEEKRHVLVMTDRKGGGPPIAGQQVLPFRGGRGMVIGSEHITQFRKVEELRPDHVAIRGHNLNPLAMVEHQRGQRSTPGLGLYDYIGTHPNERASAASAVESELTSLQATRHHALGSSNCPRLTPGSLFTLSDHPLDTGTSKHVVVRLHHSGEHSGTLDPGASQALVYRNEFMCIPDVQAFRAPPVTPRPTVRGVQTATVLGAGSEEVDVDEHGRVRVQFHWDRRDGYDEHSSCWVPVSQQWAGNGYGAMFIPRAFNEVIVEFIEGDPDRPVITGRLYHGDNRPPITLPEHKSRSTIKSESFGGGGSNELRFEDRRQAEQVFLHAQRDMDVCVRNDRRTSVRHDDHAVVRHDRIAQVLVNSHETVAGDETTKVTGEAVRHVGAAQTKIDGALKLGVGGDAHVTIGGAEYVEIGGDHHTKAGGSSVHAVGGNAVVDAGAVVHVKGVTIVIEATAGITLKGPGGFVTIDAAGVSVVGTQILLNSGGSALTGPGGAPTAPTAPVTPDPTLPKPAEADQ